MFKDRSIKFKVVILTSLVSLLSIILLSSVFFIGILNMRNNTLSVSDELGTQAASDSKSALEDQALIQLSTIARDKAEITDEKLQILMSQVTIISRYATKIYSQPDAYLPVEVFPPNAADEGIYTSQIIYSYYVDKSDLEEEVGLIGNLNSLMELVTENNIGITTTQIGVESGFIIMSDNNSQQKVDLENLEPTLRSWYVKAKENNRLVWSDVFEDAFKRGLGIACAAPVYDRENQIKGVVSVGSLLNDISGSIVSAEIGESGYAFVINEEGLVIMSKTMDIDSNGNIIKEQLNENSNEEVTLIAEKMMNGESGVARVNLNGKDVFMAYEPLSTLPWSIAAVIDVEEVLAPADEGAQKIIELKEEASESINGIIIAVLLSSLIVLVVTIILIQVLGYHLSKRLTRPIRDLTESVHTISGGNLDLQIDINTGDEIEDLADSFNKMTVSIKEYIKNLATVTADKERIATELNVATQIQASMLPNHFPAFPERDEFDVYATMHPAKEVGGDFYDFFLVDEKHLGVVMADVSGKGVPAALFMVIAKTLIKTHTQTGQIPSEIFTDVNNQLCENNEACMFVTAFMGVLNTETGEFIHVNAGHNPPLIRRANGDFEWIQTKPAFVLAGISDMKFTQESMMLNKGDRLYLYTDGVTEALNNEKELFGEDRLIDRLNREEVKDMSLEELLSYISKELAIFADGADQADDITMLTFEYLKD